MAAPGNLVLDGGDPRLPDYQLDDKTLMNSNSGNSRAIKPQRRKIHDPNISFEEYHYYAQQTRAEEVNSPPSGNETKLWSLIIPSKSDGGVKHATADENKKSQVMSTADARATISDEEWTNASRAMRTATRGAIFYLITTDILGPFGLPYAFATMGWGYVYISLMNLTSGKLIGKQARRCSLHCICWSCWIFRLASLGYVHGFGLL